LIAKTTIIIASFFGMASGCAPAIVLAAEPAPQAAAGDATKGLDRLRDAIKDAYNRGDPDAMTRYLHPDAVIVFPDGSVLKGRDACCCGCCGETQIRNMGLNTASIQFAQWPSINRARR
jgi:Domain of unknown function (DUF4440)